MAVCPISVFLYPETMKSFLSFFLSSHPVSLDSITSHYTIAIGTTTITIQRPYFPVQSDLKRSSKLNLFHRIPLCLASRDQCFRLCVSIRQISRYEVIKRSNKTANINAMDISFTLPNLNNWIKLFPTFHIIIVISDLF